MLADYSKSLPQIPSEVTKVIIREDRGLEVLRNAGSKAKDSGAPSWVATWGPRD